MGYLRRPHSGALPPRASRPLHVTINTTTPDHYTTTSVTLTTFKIKLNVERYFCFTTAIVNVAAAPIRVVFLAAAKPRKGLI